MIREPTTSRDNKFLSTLSLRRATGLTQTDLANRAISIHALLAESDNRFGRPIDVVLVFLSTLSLRRATVHYDNYNLHCVISIHALLAESDSMETFRQVVSAISIHALLAESDLYYFCPSFMPSQISIHALLAESDANSQQGKNNGHEFLSTLSLRRATFLPILMGFAGG